MALNEVALTILLVEDNDADFDLTREMLNEGGEQSYNLIHASRLSEAFEAFNEKVDAILLDLSLPDSFGWDTFTSVYEYTPHCPIILLTGLADEELGAKAIHEGAQDYLIKGQINHQLLARTIRYAIERKSTSLQLERYARQITLRNAEMAEDLNMAREIQQALLPHHYPHFSGGSEGERRNLLFSHLYRPSELLGGDFFYIQALSGSKAGIFICDVMGHGLRAAIVTAIIRGLLEELKSKADNPGEFLTEMNRALGTILRQPDQLTFVTAAYLVIDLEKNRVSFANAGHPSPIHMRITTDTVDRLWTDSTIGEPPLGIIEEHTYVSGDRGLLQNDRLVAFTDGLVEVGGSEGGQFGEARLAEYLHKDVGKPMGEIFRDLVVVIDEFSINDGSKDDICIVGAEITTSNKVTPNG